MRERSPRSAFTVANRFSITACRLGSFGRRQVFAQATGVNGAVAVEGAVTGHEEQPAGRCRHDIGTDGWVLRRQQDAVALQGRLGCHRYTGIES